MTNFRSGWHDFPDTFIAYSESTISTHQEYMNAKAGDIESALKLVDELVTDEFLIRLNNFTDDFENVSVLPVHAEERLGRNKIPIAYAKSIQETLQFELEVNIV